VFLNATVASRLKLNFLNSATPYCLLWQEKTVTGGRLKRLWLLIQSIKIQFHERESPQEALFFLPNYARLHRNYWVFRPESFDTKELNFEKRQDPRHYVSNFYFPQFPYFGFSLKTGISNFSIYGIFILPQKFRFLKGIQTNRRSNLWTR